MLENKINSRNQNVTKQNLTFGGKNNFQKILEKVDTVGHHWLDDDTCQSLQLNVNWCEVIL